MFLLDVKNLKVIKDPDLRERHLGDVQGLLFREAAKVCPQAYRAFSSRRTGQVIPVSFWHLFNQLLFRHGYRFTRTGFYYVCREVKKA